MPDAFLEQLLTSAITIGIAWGIMKSKVEALERKQDAMDEELKSMKDEFVTYKHLDAVLPAIRHSIDEIQKDIKKILLLVKRDA